MAVVKSGKALLKSGGTYIEGAQAFSGIQNISKAANMVNTGKAVLSSAVSKVSLIITLVVLSA